MKFIKNEKGEIQALLVLPIVMIISIFVVATFGSAIVPSAISQASNTSGITDYSTWSQQTKTTYSSVPTILGLDYLLVYLIILLVGVGVVTRSI